VTDRDAQALHMADQAIAEITTKLDRYRDEAAATLRTAGYEVAIMQMHRFLVTATRLAPDGVAALAAVAIVSLARDAQAAAAFDTHAPFDAPRPANPANPEPGDPS
jgi:hypothetical protein